MKKTIAILILLALIGGGVYFFLNKDMSNTKCDPGFRFVPSTQKCEPVDAIDHPNDQAIDFAKMTIQIPETNIQVELKKDGEGTKYSAIYQDPKDSSVKGAVSLDTKDSVIYSSDFILVPFILNSGGTGQFVYVGLFDIKSNSHKASVFIGDRIRVDSITLANEKIKVNFKTRLDSESFATTPTIPAQVVLQVTDQNLTEVMRLQNADYNDVEIKSPIPVVSFGSLVLKGAIPGTWYFEAVAGFEIRDENYNQIATGSIKALSDWMTVQRVPFELSTSTIAYKGKGTIIIKSDNPQGGDEGDRKMKKMFIPASFQ
jgi:hypothetical protein